MYKTHFGGFSIVQYSLNSVINSCIPVRVLGKLWSDKWTIFFSIHPNKSVPFSSYSSFISFGNINPAIAGPAGPTLTPCTENNTIYHNN